MNPIRPAVSQCRLLVLVLTFVLLAGAGSAQERSTSRTYGIQIGGELCGYSDIQVSKAGGADGPYVIVEQSTVVLVSALGSNVEKRIHVTYHVDPATWEYTYCSMNVDAGSLQLATEVIVEGKRARCTSSMLGEPLEVELTPAVVLETPLYLMHLKRELVDRGATAIEYQVLDPTNRVSPIQSIACTLAGRETVKTAVGDMDTVIVDAINQTTGVRSRTWVSVDTGMVVQSMLPKETRIFLADASVKDEVTRADVNETILTKTNVNITDVHAIAFMRVRATLEPTGAWLSAAALNVRGQRFEGTVQDNRVDGVFTIEHARYDGADAPPYPPDFADDPSVAKYLAPGAFIESDDPVLIAKAREIADGSKDAWEAAVRLSRWVAENIGYEIPGGIFSRRVYDMRVAECGGHSVLLAAFCRAVGIPARGVWGCMYVPMNGGGAFGQHAWTEIYMGDAGWIPVDSTAHQVDYVDSGHVRLGVFGSTESGGMTSISLGARTMEILDYRLDPGTGVGDASTEYSQYVGSYAHPSNGDTFEVVVRNGRLAIDIPNNIALPLNNPDDDGVWATPLTNLVYCRFPRDGSGAVSSLEFHEIVRMRRRSSPASIPEDAPDDVHQYLGGYFLAQANAEFEVIWDGESLALRDPTDGSVRPFEPTGSAGTWTMEGGIKEVSFIHDDNGGVISMSVNVTSTFERVSRNVAESRP